jgi:hypothetical protein
VRMENRWAPRRAANWRVSIRYSDGVLPNLRLRNISSNGALVQSDTLLAPRTPVELILHASEGNAMRLHRLDAVVTRVNTDSIGLLFKDLEPQVLAVVLR